MNLNDLDRLRKNMIESKKLFDDEFNLYAMKSCGNNIGDIVEVNGYSHRGKNIKFSEISAKYDNWTGEYFAVMSGYVLKNDGSESKNKAERKIPLGKAE